MEVYFVACIAIHFNLAECVCAIAHQLELVLHTKPYGGLEVAGRQRVVGLVRRLPARPTTKITILKDSVHLTQTFPIPSEIGKS